ncbi:LIC11966 family surface protein [Leptospira barantonii]|uniref:LIC11966 family surface protein n=1 Tax=Leptospira barantonii TaxID=2023184 RepID=UPI003CD0E151
MLAKNVLENVTFFLLGVSFLFCFGCKQDPVEYNHKIFRIMDGIFEDAKSIDFALEKEDYVDAKNKTQAWEQKVRGAKESIRLIGSFRGDSSFRSACDFILDIFSEHVIVYYKRLISLLEGKHSSDSQEVYDTYYKIRLRMDEADNTLKEASEKFRMEFYE